MVDYPLGTGESFKIERRDVLPTPSTTWNLRASASTGSTYDDSTASPAVQLGYRYEYRVQRFSGSTSTGPQLQTFAAVQQAPDSFHDRGRIILLVENGLPAMLGTAYDLFKDNLAGDGWTIIEKTGMTRHNDADGADNSAGVTAAKSAVSTNYVASKTNGVIILGHVSIPKSVIRYIQKSDRFHKKASPFPLPDQAISTFKWYPICFARRTSRTIPRRLRSHFIRSTGPGSAISP